MRVLLLQSGWYRQHGGEIRENSLIQRGGKHCCDITGSTSDLYIICVFGYLGYPVHCAHRRKHRFVCVSVHWHVFMHVFAGASIRVCVCVCEVFLDR